MKSWREHTQGSIVVTLAPVAALLGAPKRNRDRDSAGVSNPGKTVPASLAALEPDTLALLRRLAIATIESLGVRQSESFIADEMQAIFTKLSVTIPVSADREGTLRRAIISAMEDLEGSH